MAAFLRAFIGAAVLAPLAWNGSAAACGPATECRVAGGYYLAWIPPGATAEKPVGAIVYFHGYQGTAEGVMQDPGLMRTARELGAALIVPSGMQKTWSFPGSPSQLRNEMEFVDSVLDDALARFPITPGNIMAAGFSLGGSMSWYLACFRGERFAGFGPIAGAFWRPHPEACPSPDPFIAHVHGLSDRTVPITGRPIRDRWHQGDVRESLEFWLTRHGSTLPPMSLESDGMLTCERAPTAQGGEVELCLHDGAHEMRPEWIARAWRRLQAFRDSKNG